MQNIIDKIYEIIKKDDVVLNADMSKESSFKVGGKAKALVTAHSEEQLQEVLNLLSQEDAKHFILGNGSNTIFKDSGYSGIVVKLGDEFGKIKEISPEDVAESFGKESQKSEQRYIQAGAEALLSTVGKYALEKGLTGFEFASGIPGSVGGGVFMNAGAYDGELKDILVGITAITKDGSRVKSVCAKDLDLGYRHSAICETGDVVVSAVFALKDGNEEEIKAKMDDLMNRRNTKQPVQYPSCGSFFKRPKGYFAGKLIQDSGLSGLTVGGAQVSEKHNGFIINIGGATETDISNLMKKVQEEVKKKFGVDLEPEVRIIGD